MSVENFCIFGFTLPALLLILVFNALFILGIYQATKKGKLLHPVSLLIIRILNINYDELSEYSWRILIYEGIFGCYPCMASFWGLPFLLSMMNLGNIELTYWFCSYRLFYFIFYWCALSAINYIFSMVIGLLKKLTLDLM